MIYPGVRPNDAAGIDYGSGRTNVDHATGIRYGCISQHSLDCQSYHDTMEPVYPDPACPECGGDVIASEEVKHPELWENRTRFGCFDYACLSCRQGWSSDQAIGDEPDGYEYTGDGYELASCLDSDVMVIESPFYTLAQFCSPCVPGAGNLDNPMVGGVKTYCLDGSWFEGGVAPYPVWRVSDDSMVVAEGEVS